MSKNYLAFVVIYNLLPTDYTDERVKGIEDTINCTISSAGNGTFEANDDNMLFSFPPDPSVKSPEIPVGIDVRFRSLSLSSKKCRLMEGKIRNALLTLPGIEKRGDVAVIVSAP